MSFEKNVTKIEQICNELQDQNTTLDASLKLFEQGINIGKQCLQELSEYKGKVSVLQKQLDELVQMPFELTDED